MSASADDVQAIASRLANTDLRPSPLVDGLFQSLVAAALAITSDRHLPIGDARRLAALHRLCSAGEAHLEAHWARRIRAAPRSLHAFPYVDNYRQLVAAELAAIVATLGRVPRSLLFVGSGPLPLSAVLLGRALPGLSVTCLDRDGRAQRRGRQVARALAPASTPGSAARVPRFRRGDARAHDYSTYDVVIIAALVGLTTAEKRDLLGRVARTLGPGGLVAARSVPRDGRRLLYPRIEPACVPATLTVVAETEPPPGVINSLVLMRRAPA